jgi:rhamnogalacturonyl hydrolase YesR
MSSRLVSLQKPDGYWPVSLLSHESTPAETSGTALYTFGLAYGVQTGLLTAGRYCAAARRGWTALERAVAADGRLGWVQAIGAAPASVSAGDSQPYGVGAFLLAGTAIYDLGDGCADSRAKWAHEP